MSLSEFNYGEAGRLESSTNSKTASIPNGITEYFRYDENGNQTLSFSYWDNPATGNGIQGNGIADILVVNRTKFDAEGRAIETSQYTFTSIPSQFNSPAGLVDPQQLDDGGYIPDWRTTTIYNLAGQVATLTDRFGNVTENHYDKRGNNVETRTQAVTASGLAVWIVTRTAYDANGRVIATSEPFLQVNGGANNLKFVNPMDESVVPSGVPAFLRANYTDYDDLGRVKETRRLSGVEIGINVDTTNFDEPIYETTFTLPAAASSILSRSTTEYDKQGRVLNLQHTTRRPTHWPRCS